MYRNHTIGVVVPAYNEEEFLADVVRDIPEFVDAVFLVDDASTDGTWGEAGKVMREQSDGRPTIPTTTSLVERDQTSFGTRVADAETIGHITRLRHRENRGAGGAIKTGYLAALVRDIDVIVTIDGDGQMDSDRMPSLLEPIVAGQAEYAKGNRFANSDVLHEMPPFRLFGNILLTGLTRISSGYWGLSDPQNGFTAISRDALRVADIESIWEYYGYMNQLVARLNAENIRIADVPMPATYGDEESSIDYGQYIRRVSVLLLVSFFQRLWKKHGHPDYHSTLFGYAGGTLVGVVSLLRVVLSAATKRSRASATEIAWGVILGTVVIAIAALLDRDTEPDVIDSGSTRVPGVRSKHEA